MTVQFFLRHQWYDKRLVELDGEKIRLSGDSYKDIWIPDLYFSNAVFAKATSNQINAEQVTFINSTDGNVWHVRT